MDRRTMSTIVLSFILLTATGTVATPPGPENWQLVFSDEFDGNSLDTNKWSWKFDWGASPINGCSNSHIPDGVNIVSGGTLKIRALNPRESGMIASWPSFWWRHGYIEGRMKVPKGAAWWSAFWNWRGQASLGKDWDILDQAIIYGRDTRTVNFKQMRQQKATGNSYTGPDFSEDFHTFAADWNEERVIYYVDGTARWTATTNVPVESLYVGIYLNVCFGQGENMTYPSQIEVDWVRVYTRREGGPVSLRGTGPCTNAPGGHYRLAACGRHQWKSVGGPAETDDARVFRVFDVTGRAVAAPSPKHTFALPATGIWFIAPAQKSARGQWMLVNINPPAR
jgi:beta-glucanase (GH16 family)